MPLLIMKDNILKEMKGEKNTVPPIEVKDIKFDPSTMDRTVSRDYNAMLYGVDFEQKHSHMGLVKKKKANLPASVSNSNQNNGPLQGN